MRKKRKEMIETARKAKREVSVIDKKKRDEYKELIQKKKEGQCMKWLKEIDKSLKKL